MRHTPFVRGIPSNSLYKTRQNAEVLSRLSYTAKNQLFAVLIGEPGTGKTSTLRRLKDELPESEFMVLYVSDSRLTPRSFYNFSERQKIPCGSIRKGKSKKYSMLLYVPSKGSAPPL